MNKLTPTPALGIALTILSMTAFCGASEKETSSAAPDRQNIDVKKITKSVVFQDDKGPSKAFAFTADTVTENRQTGCFGGLDCIPSYSDPKVLAIDKTSYVKDNDGVLVVAIKGKARAYPLSTLYTHEIANDVIDGVPFSVSYCPLTGTGIAFSGIHAGKPITFGVSGQLFNNNLILYDHQTKSLWPQLMLAASEGSQKNNRLSVIAMADMTYAAFKTLYPQGEVVSGDFAAQYPYGDYATNNDKILFSHPRPSGTELASKDLVLAVIGPETARIYPFKAMGERRVINDTVDGQAITVIFDKQAQTALAYVRPTIDGNVVDLTISGDTFPFSLQGGQQTWSFLGAGATSLKRVETAIKGYWFGFSVAYNVSIWSSKKN